MKRDQLSIARARRAQGKCRVCGSISGLHVHHLVPRSRTQQGAEDDANLIVLCQHHHAAAHLRTLDLGLHITPAEGAHVVLMVKTVRAADRLLYPTDYDSKVAA